MSISCLSAAIRRTTGTTQRDSLLRVADPEEVQLLDHGPGYQRLQWGREEVTTTGRGRSVQKTAFGRTHCDTAVSADQASRPLKRRDPELYLQAVSMDLDPSDHAFFKGRQHVQNGAESAASERHKRINKMRTSTTGREMNHPPLSALCTDQAPCCPPGRCRTPRRPRPQGAPRHAACRGLRVTPLLFPRRTLCCPPG